MKSVTGSGGASQVEGHVARGAEVDGDTLSIIRVDRETCRSHHDFAGDRPAQCLGQRAARIHGVDVELDSGTSLTTLKNVRNQTIRHGSVSIREIHGGIAGSISERSLILPKRSKLAVGNADRGHVDLGPSHLQTPFPHLGHRTKCLVSDRGQTAAEVAGNSGSSGSSAANGAADRHDPGGGIVCLHEVIASSDGVRGGSTSGIGQSDRVINLESVEVANSDVRTSGREGRSGKAGSGIGGLVPKRA